MKRLGPPTMLREFHGEPIEQRLIHGGVAVVTKVEYRGDQGRAKMSQPKMIDGDSRGEGVVAVSDFFGEGQATAGTRFGIDGAERRIVSRTIGSDFLSGCD